VDVSKLTLIVAHPDDEVLWFAGALRHAAQTVVCYGDNPLSPRLGEQRRKLLAGYPVVNVDFLDIAEPRRSESRKPANAQTGGAPIISEEEAEHRWLLLDRLRQSTRSSGIAGLLTHNPWGEYGHEDHMHVNAAATALADALKLPLYVSSFVSLRRLVYAKTVLDAGVSEYIEVPVDQEFVSAVHNHYRSHACWTWRKNWQWPSYDIYLRLGGVPITQSAYALRLFQPVQR
jgi:LmbE family N-acetylglucosaminyl deacetylase